MNGFTGRIAAAGLLLVVLINSAASAFAAPPAMEPPCWENLIRTLVEIYGSSLYFNTYQGAEMTLNDPSSVTDVWVTVRPQDLAELAETLGVNIPKSATSAGQIAGAIANQRISITPKNGTYEVRVSQGTKQGQFFPCDPPSGPTAARNPLLQFARMVVGEHFPVDWFWLPVAIAILLGSILLGPRLRRAPVRIRNDDD